MKTPDQATVGPKIEKTPEVNHKKEEFINKAEEILARFTPYHEAKKDLKDLNRALEQASEVHQKGDGSDSIENLEKQIAEQQKKVDGLREGGERAEEEFIEFAKTYQG